MQTMMRRAGRRTIGLIFIALLGLSLAACGGGLTLPTIPPPTGGSATAPATTAPTGPSASPSSSTAPSSADTSAIRAVIQRANDAQVQAVAAQDPSPMKDTATAAYYTQSAQDLQDLLDAGISDIKLVNLQWGSITLQSASTAQATTTETWRTTAADGSTSQNTDANVYILVREGGAWKIQDDQHPNAQQQPSSQQPFPQRPSRQQPAPQPSQQPSPQQPFPQRPSRQQPTPQPSQQPSQQPTGTKGATPAPAATVAPDQQGYSRNWAGYAATGGTYTAVAGMWTIPTVDTSVDPAGDATWVGIGGVDTTDLIQAGTVTEVQNGRVRYSAWVETLPQASKTVPLTVNAGDQVSVAIAQQSDGTWQITMRDLTTNGSYQTNVTYNSTRSSAEWIEEAPAVGRRTIMPLDSFDTVNISGATTTVNGQQQTPAQAGAKPVAMHGSGGRAQVLAQPSALGADGASFSVMRTSTP